MAALHQKLFLFGGEHHLYYLWKVKSEKEGGARDSHVTDTCLTFCNWQGQDYSQWSYRLMAGAHHRLDVTVISASALPWVEKGRGCDSMVEVSFEGKKKKTEVVIGVNPEWDQILSFPLKKSKPSPDSKIIVEVYDYERVRNRLLGSTEFDFRSVENNTNPMTRRIKEGSESTVTLKFKYYSRERESLEREATGFTSDAALEGTQGSHITGREEEGYHTTHTTPAPPTISEDNRNVSSQDDEDEDDIEPNRPLRKKSVISRQQSSLRSKLPRRLTDFQVRVHVIQGRQLQGGHMNPVVKVVCGDKAKRSIQAKGTNNPFFDQLFFFNFHDFPSEVFDKTLELRVLNAKINLVYSEIIGTFKLDLGQVYDQPDQCYLQKWLLLSDPESPSLGAKGYLLFSVHVLSPGVVPKPYPPLNTENIDIENNVLSATGVDLNVMTLQIRIYRAHDLPQMDPEYYEYFKKKIKRLFGKEYKMKDCVDPYCTVKFAGHKRTTNVRKNNDDPIWNEQFNIAFRFPSMSERIRIRLKDYDKGTKDDTIGTTFIRLPEISSPGSDSDKNSGYLPTFGPCFVNVYGSPREFSVLPDKYDHLNKGVFRGVSYRGRVMIEIVTLPDRTPTSTSEDILSIHTRIMEPFLKTLNYKLFAVFYSATMISPANSTVQFEVSIGNYGNALDKDTGIQMSTTPPTMPVFDGNYYYYMPWHDHKPCVLVDSKWEDNTHRIESMNLLIHISDKLAKSLDYVRGILSDDDEESRDHCIYVLMEALNTTLDDISAPLPTISKSDDTINELDKLKYTARIDELATIRTLIKTNSQTERNDLTLEAVLDLAEDILSRLEALAIEPQASVPDIIIWMMSGGKRVACYRLPAHEFMYSDKPTAYCGKNCDKILNIHLKAPAVVDEKELEDTEPAGALLRIKMWLGLESKWKREMNQSLALYAETYENEASQAKGWGKNFLRRPQWSDATGLISQPPDKFKLPSNWEWEDDEFIGDWEVMTSTDTGQFQTEGGQAKYVERIYEYQTRGPFSRWPVEDSDYLSTWKDEHGKLLMPYEDSEVVYNKDTLPPPEGWEWDPASEWEVAPHRVADDQGWEYNIKPPIGTWSPSSRKYHLVRRRQWYRTRIQVAPPEDASIASKSSAIDYEGWEYARFHDSSYQRSYNALFLARRRRHIRKIKTSNRKNLSNLPRFYFSDYQQQVPRLYLPMEGDPLRYELRVYLYQARDLFAGDSTGFSDPFCIVSFDRYSQTTRDIDQTLNPLWDHTCVFDDIKMYGSPLDIKQSPPKIMIEIFDKDNVGKDYLGYVECYPIVRIDETKQRLQEEALEEGGGVHVSLDLETSDGSSKDPMTGLSWYPVTRYGSCSGELLAAFELFLVECVPPTPPISKLKKSYGELKDGRRDDMTQWYTVPDGIRPVYETKTIEILCWGVRDLKKYRLGSVTSPFIKIECGGEVMTTSHIVNTRRNPNFTDLPIIMTLQLPTNQLFSPPLNIFVYDKRAFGQTPLVGTHSIKLLEDSPPDFPSHHYQPQSTLRKRKSKSGQVAIEVESRETYFKGDPDYVKDSRFDWWTKYRLATFEGTSIDIQEPEQQYVDENHDRLKLYHHELEKEFHNFYDIIRSYPLYRGKGSTAYDDSAESSRYAGTFKGRITVRTGGDSEIETVHHLPTKDLCPVIIRVYVIEGIGLLPLDPNGKSDPYLKLSIGKCVRGDDSDFIPNTLNPLFGRMYELTATLPLDHVLKIQVLDHDYGSRDDFIGQTEIDIENRFISRYRATCGLPESFSKNGPNHWRDKELPKDILDWYCTVWGWHKPVWTNKGVIFNNEEYTLDHPDVKPYVKLHKYIGSDEQQLALALLHKEKKLVPEHVETRTLENPNQPGISQGSLRLWVDIFPKSYDLPPPVDISPRKPEDYELRVIVYDVKDVELADYNLLTDEEMSDIYVKGWLRGQEETQKTDIHYRSFDGEGNFNYRFVFPFQYLPAEKQIVVTKKDHFYSISKTESRVLPYLTIQVWDNDKFKLDEHLGTIEFDLTAIPKGTKTTFLDTTNTTTTATPDPMDSLFEKKRIRRWWSLDDDRGRIELELQILTKEEAELSPAGKGRDDPNMNPYLPPPERPKTSFFWLTSPLKTFRYIIWRYYKWHIIFGILIIFVVIGVIVFIYSTPDYLAQYFLDRLLPL